MRQLSNRQRTSSPFLAMVVVVLAAGSVSGCFLMGENQAATEKCKTQRSQKACAICCPNNGARASTWWGSCTCQGESGYGSAK
jgi:hypothetical protein